MTNKEALQASITLPSGYLKDNSLELALTNAGVDPDSTYSLNNQKGVETALAGLIFILATSPASISELDISITGQKLADLLALRSVLIKRWNLPDEMALEPSTIQDATQFWGTTSY